MVRKEEGILETLAISAMRMHECLKVNKEERIITGREPWEQEVPGLQQDVGPCPHPQAGI